MAWHMPGIASPDAPFQWLLRTIHRNGAYGVPVFFVVSGYLISRLIDGQKGGLFKPRFKEFYVRRAARIIPLVLLHIVVGILIVHNVTHFKPLFWVSLFTFSYNWYQAFWPNPVPGLYWGLLWSLAVEEQFYLFYPPILLWLGGIRRFLVLALAVVLLGLFWRMGFLFGSHNLSIFSYKASFGSFDQIALGALLYLTARNYRQVLLKNKGLSSFLCLAGALVVAAAYAWTDINLPTDCIYSPLLVALGAFLFILGGLHLRSFESPYLKILTWPGKFSYGIYLFHGLIYYFIYNRFLAGVNIYGAFLIFGVVSTTLAALSYRFFEVPESKMILKFFNVKKRFG